MLNGAPTSVIGYMVTIIKRRRVTHVSVKQERLVIGKQEVGRHDVTELDKDWLPPPEYRTEDASTLVKYWRETFREATGKYPKWPPFVQMSYAEFLLARPGFLKSMRILKFMSTPKSKYYQFPYGIKVVSDAEEEFDDAVTGKGRAHAGFIGPAYKEVN